MKRRGRGRPRNTDMGDLDINLIREFARRPGFYDRNDPHFKDKLYLNRAWDEISHSLGYDVHLLKDRMLQLRNRYNLEKRRIENLRTENPGRIIRSPWPLFQHLHFLSDHIRPRRSFKTMITRASGNVDNNDSGSAKGYDEGYSNGNVDVKDELGTDLDSDEDQGNKNDSNYPIDEVDMTNCEVTLLNHSSVPRNDGLLVKNIDSLKRSHVAGPVHSRGPISHEKRQRNEPRLEKYAAFGKFLWTSLCDLPEERALPLLEKITSDLVKALVENENAKKETKSTEA